MEISNTPPFPSSALVTAREIVETVRISRAHLHAQVKADKFPAPAIKDGTRYTRWRWSDIENYLRDPQAWINSRVAGRVSTAQDVTHA